MKLLKCFAVSVMGAAAGLMFYCGSFYFRAYRENCREQSKYEKIQEECKTAGETETQKKEAETPQKASHKKKVIEESFGISWKKLRETNPDTIGWVEIPGADISYPVVQGKDDEFYLTHSVTGEESSFGSIFLGYDHKKNFMDSRSLVYGHNMEGNMMFANLNRYEDPGFLERCPEFYITTPKRKFCYEIFSVEQAAVEGMGFRCGYRRGSEEYGEQLRILKASSMYDTGVIPDETQRMVTLVTCNSRLEADVRMAVHGICRQQVTLRQT